MKSSTSRFGVMHSAVSLVQSLSLWAPREGRVGGDGVVVDEELQPKRSRSDRMLPPRGAELATFEGMSQRGAADTLFRGLQAPGGTGMTHPEKCRCSDQPDESESSSGTNGILSLSSPCCLDRP